MTIVLDRPSSLLKGQNCLISKSLLCDLANGWSGRGHGVLRRAWTGQKHDPIWSVGDVLADMVRSSEHYFGADSGGPREDFIQIWTLIPS